MPFVVEDSDKTTWIVNPPFKCALTDEKMYKDYMERGWIPKEVTKVHKWTLNQFRDVTPGRPW
jgi:hypothetical protein